MAAEYVEESQDQYRTPAMPKGEDVLQNGAVEPSPAIIEKPERRVEGKIGNLTVQRLNQLTGERGWYRDGIYTIRFSPSLPDKVSVAGIALPSPLIPSSSIYFRNSGPSTFITGDFVLLQSQVNPVIDMALDNGLNVTSLHNPFLWDSPRTLLLHIDGTGDTTKLASSVGKIVSWIREGPCPTAVPGSAEPAMREGATNELKTEEFVENGCPSETKDVCPAERACVPEAARTIVREGKDCAVVYEDGGMDMSFCGINPSETSLNIDNLRNILGVRGRDVSGVYRFTFGKTLTERGQKLDWKMGIKSEANFAGSNDKAVVTGYFAVHENELQGVLKALRDSKIDILSIASHTAAETPRTLYVHYLGTGKANDLAYGIRNALRSQGKMPARIHEGEMRHEGEMSSE
jgi:hypothetical protein